MTLTDQLLEEMAAAWRRGERPRAEDFLTRHPELCDEPPEALRLVYEELCLRQEVGEAVAAAEFLARFPQWHDKLEIMLDCHRLMEQGSGEPGFPEVGDALGDLDLVAELGHGAMGRVFLALQRDLADRPVVLKMSSGESPEHLSLARLWNHTHIVPLYWERLYAERRLHVLCMPFLGGTALNRLLEDLSKVRPPQRTGRDLVAALDRANAAHPLDLAAKGPARELLAGLAYPEAICWIGACLAEALQYAHDRGLVHLDLKPANVLMAADGMPLLLDFHLAQAPIPAGPPPTQLGGTMGYMAPEQKAVLAAVRRGLDVVDPVTHQADVYALGALLYESLSGELPFDPGQPPLHQVNAQVSVGLSDIVGRSLATDPGQRYARAGDLGADLMRHLHAQPLQGVPNRSWAERWRKWRRRRPYAARFAGMALAVALAVLAALAGTGLHFRQRWVDARAELAAGQAQVRDRNFAGAVHSLGHGLALADGLPGAEDLRQSLTDELRRARRAEAAQRLHEVADLVRFRLDARALPPADLQGLANAGRETWDARGRLLDATGTDLGPETELQIRHDLLDLVLVEADVRIRLADERDKTDARRQALATLREAGALLGPSAALAQEYRRHARAAGAPESRLFADHAPATAWDYYALGRSRMLAGELAAATLDLERAIELQPQGFWPHFHLGVCQFRQGRSAEAVTAFTVCIALAPETAESFFNRALACSELGDADRARRDFARALQLRPSLAGAMPHRAPEDCSLP